MLRVTGSVMGIVGMADMTSAMMMAAETVEATIAMTIMADAITEALWRNGYANLCL